MKQEFGAHEIEREDYPDLWLKIIYLRVPWKAEKLMDQAMHIVRIMDDQEMTTIEIVKFIETYLKARFPGLKTDFSLFINFFIRSEPETRTIGNHLTTHKKVNFWISTGGRQTTQSQPLSDMDRKVIIQVIVSGFYDGNVK